MGWLGLIALTALAALSAISLGGYLGQGHGRIFRWMVALVAFHVTLLACLYAAGAVGWLSPWPVAGLSIAIHGGIIAAVYRARGYRDALHEIESDLRAVAGVLASAYRDRELAAYVLPLAVVALLVSGSIAWHYPSWSWDVVWYHLPMTSYALQTASIDWVPTHVWYTNSYPRNVEMLSAWSVLFPRDTKLDDLSQFPAAFLGVLAVAALCRRGGVQPPLAVSLGVMWLLAPAVFLQLHTTHADIAAGAFFLTAFFALTGPRFERPERWLAFFALALYVGTKVTGLFHLVLLGPLVASRLVHQFVIAREDRGRIGIDLALFAAALIALGGFVYVRNMVRTGNPFWPARVTVPVVGIQLPGELEHDQVAGPPAFFGAPGAFRRMVDNWYAEGAKLPDIREGAFGSLFRYLGLPVLLWVVLTGLFFRDRWHRLSLGLLAALAVLVPAAWWGRFTLGLPAAALAAVAVLHRDLRTPYLRVPLSAAIAALATFGFAQNVAGYVSLPSAGLSWVTRQEDEDRLRRTVAWMWPPEAARLKEQEMTSGAVLAYDEAIVFLGEAWTRDLRNRVEYVPHGGDDERYLRRLRELGVRWVSVRRGSHAELLLRARSAAFEPLFPVPMSEAMMYRVRGPF